MIIDNDKMAYCKEVNSLAQWCQDNLFLNIAKSTEQEGKVTGSPIGMIESAVEG